MSLSTGLIILVPEANNSSRFRFGTVSWNINSDFEYTHIKCNFKVLNQKTNYRFPARRLLMAEDCLLPRFDESLIARKWWTNLIRII